MKSLIPLTFRLGTISVMFIIPAMQKFAIINNIVTDSMESCCHFYAQLIVKKQAL
jgi:hypothetical protein